MKATKILVISIAFLFAFVSTVGAFQPRQVRKPGQRTFPKPIQSYQVFDNKRIATTETVWTDALNASEMNLDTTDFGIIIAHQNTATNYSDGLVNNAIQRSVSITYRLSTDGASWSIPAFGERNICQFATLGNMDSGYTVRDISESKVVVAGISNTNWAQNGGYTEAQYALGASKDMVQSPYSATRTAYITGTTVYKAPYIKIGLYNHSENPFVFDMHVISQ